MVRGWYQCCCGLNGFLGGNIPLVFPWRQDGGSCLSVWHPDLGEGGGGGSSEAFEALGLTDTAKVDVSPFWSGTQGPNLPSGHCMTGAFFGVFGAATKCAMCYVAWFIFIIFFTSYKAHL